ncbi:hypothetical protein QCA50_019852 [Cerrena zonata]|uniref:Transmembrane protein n=1 Tax=Cerrena zonata TaxID=2478898 RepID=A0AAW0F9W2_9APHY
MVKHRTHPIEHGTMFQNSPTSGLPINTSGNVSLKPELRSQTGAEYLFFDPYIFTRFAMVHTMNPAALTSLIVIFSLIASIAAIPVSFVSSPFSAGSETLENEQNDVSKVVPMIRQRSNWGQQQWGWGEVGGDLENMQFGTSAFRPNVHHDDA